MKLLQPTDKLFVKGETLPDRWTDGQPDRQTGQQTYDYSNNISLTKTTKNEIKKLSAPVIPFSPLACT